MLGVRMGRRRPARRSSSRPRRRFRRGWAGSWCGAWSVGRGRLASGRPQAGEQLRQLATAFREAGEGLKSQGSGSEAPARIIVGLSERADQFG